MTVGWRARRAAEADVSVDVMTTGDVAMGNNIVRGHAEIMGATDLELRVAPAASGTAGATFDFPAISVLNGAEKAFATRLEVTLPAEVTLVSLSASNAICSGSTVLRCEFDEIDAHGTATLNLTVRASQRGTHMSSAQAHVSERHQPGQRQPRGGGQDFRQHGNRHRQQRRRRWWILGMAEPGAAGRICDQTMQGRQSGVTPGEACRAHWRGYRNFAVILVATWLAASCAAPLRLVEGTYINTQGAGTLTVSGERVEVRIPTRGARTPYDYGSYGYTLYPDGRVQLFGSSNSSYYLHLGPGLRVALDGNRFRSQRPA